MVIGKQQYQTSDDEIAKVRQAVIEAASAGTSASLTFEDADGDAVFVVWTPGVFFAVHTWDVPELPAMPNIPMPTIPPLRF
jgi:hypothetical protein